MVKSYRTPGVYLESVIPEKEFVLETGIPAFLGLVRKGEFEAAGTGLMLRDSRTPGVFRIEPLPGVSFGYRSGTADFFPLFSTFTSAKEAMGGLLDIAFLGSALRGFFENGGKKCYLHPLCYDETLCLAHEAVNRALVELEDLAEADLICVPDLMWLYREDETVTPDDVFEIQNRLLGHCKKVTGRFAVLDTLPGADDKAAIVQRKKLKGDSGALYHPWLKPVGEGSAPGLIPPSGHVCGIYARTDRERGVHKAPANEEILGVSDVETIMGNSGQDILNPENVNVIRSFPGRGIRIWGSRTLSRESEWTYVNVRRFFLTLSRWLEGYMVRLVFEPNDSSLWNRIVRDVTGHLNQAFLAGALQGNSPREAFYVICDSGTNTEEQRDRGFVVTEIGLAPAAPMEFIVIRIVHSDGGTLIQDSRETGPVDVTPKMKPTVLPALAITHITYSVEGPDVEGEYALIENRDSGDVDLGNWTLRDRAGHVYTFPRLTLAAGNSCRVWTKTGTDTSRDLFWGMNHAVWNNTGDQAELRDREGRTVSNYSYTGR